MKKGKEKRRKITWEKALKVHLIRPGKNESQRRGLEGMIEMQNIYPWDDLK